MKRLQTEKFDFVVATYTNKFGEFEFWGPPDETGHLSFPIVVFHNDTNTMSESERIKIVTEEATILLELDQVGVTLCNVEFVGASDEETDFVHNTVMCRAELKSDNSPNKQMIYSFNSEDSYIAFGMALCVALEKRDAQRQQFAENDRKNEPRDIDAPGHIEGVDDVSFNER